MGRKGGLTHRKDSMDARRPDAAIEWAWSGIEPWGQSRDSFGDRLLEVSQTDLEVPAFGCLIM